MKKYLQEKGFVDISKVKVHAEQLAGSIDSNTEKAKVLYEFVKDRIAHSADVNESLLTKYASEVLEHKHGICFAKSILLAALLRALNIPAGFGYQKLMLDDEKYPWLVLHGYVFIYLDEFDKWIKVDPRGNTGTIHARFSTGEPVMSFPVRKNLGEIDFNINYDYPPDAVVDFFNNHTHRNDGEFLQNMPGDCR